MSEERSITEALNNASF